MQNVITDKQPLSVSDAMALAKGALEDISIMLIGEVSQVSDKAGYKAVYFTVKDDKAALPCMIWNNRYRTLGLKLEVGQRVELKGRFTVYTLKGRMNFDVSSISLAGEGNLRLKVNNLARKLEAEGLMRQERKRSLPEYTERIGLVTSPRGAVVHDVLRTLRRRFTPAQVILAGVAVEGVDAPSGIIKGLQSVVDAGVEVVLIVRGGGSFEDLMPFNDEQLARAIAHCEVPVVTGIGHEPDTTIADMVADVRASTPTGAAEAVSPSRDQMNQEFTARMRALNTSIERQIEREKTHIAHVADRPVFRDSNKLFAQDAQTLDVMAERLSRALPTGIDIDRTRLQTLAVRLRAVMPRAVERERARTDALKGRLSVAGPAILPRFESSAKVVAARLHDLSPLAILGRGYAVARDNAGRIVKSVDQVSVGSSLDVTVAYGEITCRVEETRHINTSVESWEEST